ncbi:hypothetical protein [Aneurinibacillus terranovensis]|uniref:hypothetical protein n=1 Tax=Aneurinibacillus terranovensis TaxID=278991 RepID=UPI0004266027|nr:hypothetical protein [Aneurinibacillus terranovensis]
MRLTSGSNVTVNIWERGITFHGKIEQWNEQEVIVTENRLQNKWNFAYNDILNGKIKISPKKVH